MPGFHDAIRDAIVDVLGEDEDDPVVVRVDGQDRPLDAAFRAPSEPDGFAEVGMRRAMPTIGARLADWRAVGGRVGAVVFVRGVRYVAAAENANASDFVEVDLRTSK